jgi:hypothetical protein
VSMPEHRVMPWEDSEAVPEPSPDETVLEQHTGAFEAFLDETPASTAPDEQETVSSTAETDVPQATPSYAGPDDAMVSTEVSETEENRPSDEAEESEASASTELADTSPETAPSEPAAS